MDCTIRVAKTKALISFAVTAKLICVFVFAYAKSRFSADEAHIKKPFKRTVTVLYILIRTGNIDLNVCSLTSIHCLHGVPGRWVFLSNLCVVVSQIASLSEADVFQMKR